MIMEIVSQKQQHGQSEQDNTQVVFLSAPMTTYQTDEYASALTLIAQRHPHVCILSARDLWVSSDHWRTSYRDILAPVTLCYILADPHGYVGKGVYAEWEYLNEKNILFVALLPGCLEYSTFTLHIINPDDWQHYAGVLPPEPPFKTSSAFELIAHAALKYPHNIFPTRVDEWGGSETPIPRSELYAALIRKDRKHGEAA